MLRLLLLLFVFLAGLASGHAHAQNPTIELVNQTAAGNVLLRIDGTAYTALPDTMMAALDSTVTTYERSFRLQEGILQRTTNLYEGYRDLSDLYAQQYAEPIFNISGGLGAMRAENDDVISGVLAGLSIRRISLWGFVNQRQTGFIIGLNQTIQFGFFR